MNNSPQKKYNTETWNDRNIQSPFGISGSAITYDYSINFPIISLRSNEYVAWGTTIPKGKRRLKLTNLYINVYAMPVHYII